MMTEQFICVVRPCSNKANVRDGGKHIFVANSSSKPELMQELAATLLGIHIEVESPLFAKDHFPLPC